MKKVAWFVTHPIQYYSPMYKTISNDKEIDLIVYYFSDFSIKGYEDKEFGKTIKWDIPLLEGYKSKVLKNYASKQHGSFFSYMNFGIYTEIKKHNYDLVVIHGWNTFSHLLVILSCLLTSTPYSLRGDTNSFDEESRTGFKQNLRKLFLKTIFNKASAIFYIGEQNKKFYEFFDVNEKRMFNMPFAVDNNYFKNYVTQINVSNEKELLGIKKDMKVILFSGKLIAKKQCDLLINALSKNKSSQYILIVLGDGKDKKNLEILAHKRNVNILFLGFINQKDIPKYYWIADIFVLPSNYEPWGLSINEAMNCECAIVVSDKVGAKDDLIQDNGFIFKSGSVDNLANKLNVLIHDDEKLESFKQASQKIIHDYSYEADLEALEMHFKL